MKAHTPKGVVNVTIEAPWNHFIKGLNFSLPVTWYSIHYLPVHNHIIWDNLPAERDAMYSTLEFYWEGIALEAAMGMKRPKGEQEEVMMHCSTHFMLDQLTWTIWE